MLLLYLIVTLVSVQAPVNSIQTWPQLVSRHPLAVILPPLRIYFRDFHWLTKVHFEPLIVIVVPCAPCSNVSTTLGSPQSSKAGGVIFVDGWRSRDLSVLDSSTAHAQGTVTECSCREVCGVISTNEKQNQNVSEKTKKELRKTDVTVLRLYS